MGARSVTANGLRFAYLSWGPSDGPLLLALHGFPDSPASFRRIAPVLASAGYRVVAPWMRGYAPTQVPRDRRYDADALAADANALHRALGGSGSAVLLGHDWGAVAAYRAAAAAPERWRRAVTLAVPPPPLLAGAPKDLDQLRRWWYMAAVQVPGVGEALVRHRHFRMVERLWADWSPRYQASDADLGPVRAAFGEAASLSAALGYYRAARRWLLHGFPPVEGWVPPRPVLYLHGEDDGTVAPRFAAGAGRVLASGSSVQVWPGVGHFLHLEAPARVAAEILAFLGGRPGDRR